MNARVSPHLDDITSALHWKWSHYMRAMNHFPTHNPEATTLYLATFACRQEEKESFYKAWESASYYLLTQIWICDAWQETYRHTQNITKWLNFIVRKGDSICLNYIYSYLKADYRCITFVGDTVYEFWVWLDLHLTHLMPVCTCCEKSSMIGLTFGMTLQYSKYGQENLQTLWGLDI